MQNGDAQSFSFNNDLELYSSHAEGLAESNGLQPVRGTQSHWVEIPRHQLRISEQLTTTGLFETTCKGVLTRDDGRVIPCFVKIPKSE